MSETTANKIPNESSHHGTVEPAAYGRRCPGFVKMVAAVVLLMAGVNFSYSVFFFAVSSHVWLAGTCCRAGIA